ncbi:MAG: hypothetical protein JNL18_03135 [Planctomycetaceae bacterium]|nr:hypothetical protein [Planctomycetaceae bacterium]
MALSQHDGGRWRRSATRLAAVVVAVAVPSSAHAQLGFLYDWNNSAGGAYASNGNWSPVGVPDAANEGAGFNLNSTYNVSLAASYSVGSWNVGAGNVTFDVASVPTFTPRHTFAAGSFNVSSAANGSAAIRLNNAAATVTGPITIGAGALSSGQLTVSSNSTTSGNGALILGGAGQGQLDVQASAGSGFLGICCFPRQGSVGSATTIVGQSVGGSGVANIAGIWNAGDLIVGDAGQGTINMLATSQMLAGQTVRSAGILSGGSASIAAQPGSVGTVNVTGATILGPSASWSLTGNLAVGGTTLSAGGTGVLAMGLGNQATVGGNLKMWPGGTLDLSQSSALSVTGAAELGGALRYSLLSTPVVNDEFQVLDAAGVFGTFSSVTLPPLTGNLRWSVLYNPTNVKLRVLSAAADFDEDGDVDNIDLIKWRLGFATGTTHLQGDADGDTDSDGADFLIWQQQFGATPPIATASATVPEPTSLVLGSLVVVALSFARNRRRTFAAAPQWPGLRDAAVRFDRLGDL